MNGSLKGNCSCYLHGFAMKLSLVLSIQVKVINAEEKVGGLVIYMPEYSG